MTNKAYSGASTRGTEMQIVRMRVPSRLLGREGLITSGALMQVPTRSRGLPDDNKPQKKDG